MLAGPSTFFPLGWVAKKQTAISRSATEAEIVSLAKSLFEEAVLAMGLWDLLVGRPIRPWIFEDNQATI